MSDYMWVLDTGASNHMTGSRSMLTQIDSNVQGTVQLGDGSRVTIQGMGSVVMQDQSRGHKVLTYVYYIPEMKCNIVSLSQLEEKGLKYEGKIGKLCVYDQECNLLIVAQRASNRLYTARFDLTSPICLLTNSEEVGWKWHA
jgi:hypothetical protein